MKQWQIKIIPKCKGGNEVFVTSTGAVRPCMWINERSKEKLIFDNDDKFNMSHTPFNEIIDVHLKKFVDDIEEDPYNALKVCFYECTQKRIP